MLSMYFHSETYKENAIWWF